MAEKKTSLKRPLNRPLRRFLIRVLALLVGLLPIAIFESALRYLGYPTVEFTGDPLIDAAELKPLFEKVSGQVSTIRIGESRLDLFCPVEFEANKKKDVFRIFALGGSTTYGEPYASATAFPEFVGAYLRAANPGLSVEVINCGGLSYASYRIRFIMEEVLEYSPDLILLYTGHNEFLEKRGLIFARQSMESLATSWPNLQFQKLTRFKTVQFFSQMLGTKKRTRSEFEPTKLAREVDALLDYEGGLDEYQRGELNRDLVASEFRFNLVQMARLARDSDVPLLIVKPVSNLLDTPPFKFQVDPDIEDEQRHEILRHWDTATKSHSQAVAEGHAQKILQLDPRHAGALYMLGRIAAGRKEFVTARELLLLAKDADVCPLRAPSTIVQTLDQVCEEYNLPAVDANSLFESQSEGGIVGDRWMVDHIHPSVDGHRILGEEIASQCFANGIAEIVETGWRENAIPLIESHLSGLGEAYYLRGKQRLEGLRLWTQGRAKKVRNSADPGHGNSVPDEEVTREGN